MDPRIFDIVSAKIATRKLTAEIELERIINEKTEESSESITEKILFQLAELSRVNLTSQLWMELLKQTQQRPEEANNNKNK